MRIADGCGPARLISPIVMCLAVALFVACAPRGSNAATQTNTSDYAGATNAAAKTSGHAMQNPYGGDPQAVAAGKKLYMTYGCYGCHGLKGGGHMGPSLIDDAWRYGSSDADLFETITKGRPGGMPAWGETFTEKQIWQVIAYVRHLIKQAEAE